MGPLVRIGDAVLPEGVVLERTVASGVERVRLTATRDLTGMASGWFWQLGARVAVRVEGEPSYLGFAYTQFALPVIAGPSLEFDFNPSPGLHSPPVLGVLLARVEQRHLLLAPVDNPHEQVIGVADGGLVWGWHGDLDEVPAGFSTTLGIYVGDSAGRGMPTRSSRTCPIGRTTGPPIGIAPKSVGRSGPASPRPWRPCEPMACRSGPSSWIRGAINTRSRVRSRRSVARTSAPPRSRRREGRRARSDAAPRAS